MCPAIIGICNSQVKQGGNEMDYFMGSIKLMLIVYALAAGISFAVAWIIKSLFASIKMKKAITMRVQFAKAPSDELGEAGQRSGA